MNDLSFFESYRDEEGILFGKSVRRLLECTNVLAEVDSTIYDFISYGNHREDINSYLSAIGYGLIVDDSAKYARLINDEDSESTANKRTNLYRLERHEKEILLVLLTLFLEKVGRDEEVYVAVGDIVDKLGMYGISINHSNRNQKLDSALSIFKTFNLIGIPSGPIDEYTPIRLYPSLKFSMNTEDFKAYVDSLTSKLIKENE